MRNILSRTTGIMVMTVLIIAVVYLAFVSANGHEAGQGSFHQSLAKNHLWIMVGLIIVSVAFGFFWSSALYGELRKTKKSSEQIVEILTKFLGSSEKTIITHLLSGEESTQSAISRLPGMDRVKAHRSLKMLAERGMVEIEQHGKQRKVRLSVQIRESIRFQ